MIESRVRWGGATSVRQERATIASWAVVSLSKSISRMWREKTWLRNLKNGSLHRLALMTCQERQRLWPERRSPVPTSNKETAASTLSSLLTWYSGFALLPSHLVSTITPTAFAPGSTAASLSAYAKSCHRASLTMNALISAGRERREARGGVGSLGGGVGVAIASGGAEGRVRGGAD